MKTLRIMSYNLHSGIGTDGKIDYARLAARMAEHAPDLAGLQEVAVDFPGSPEKDPLAFLGGRLGMNAFFTETVQPVRNGGKYRYGIGILSRFKAEKIDGIRLPAPSGSEPRAAIFVKAEIEPGVFVYFVCTHLTWEPGEAFEQVRLEQLNAIRDRVREKQYFPAILTGDFNARPDAPCVRSLAGEWRLIGSGEPTFPSPEPEIKIDYIAVCPRDAFRECAYEVVPETVVSDHRPITAELCGNGADA